MAGSLRRRVAANGRVLTTFGLDSIVDYGSGPDSWRRELETWTSVGGTNFSVRTMSTARRYFNAPPMELASVADHIRALERFIAVVGP